jgi:NCS1 family nucleobase:cation symporter-1
LSAYSVFLSSIAGVIICDYYIVRKGYYSLRDLYSAQKSSPYFYWFGWSWRGYTAYICGIAVNIVGFVGAIGVKVCFLFYTGVSYPSTMVHFIPPCTEYLGTAF